MTIAPYNILKPQIKPDWSLPAPDPVAEIFASWVRVIELAPIENKLALFGMMARDAAAWANSFRHQAIDDMWLVAGEVVVDDRRRIRAMPSPSLRGARWASTDAAATP
jgi:hypothetical protein